MDETENIKEILYRFERAELGVRRVFAGERPAAALLREWLEERILARHREQLAREDR